MKSFLLPRFSGFFCAVLFWLYVVELEAQIAFGPQQVIAQSETNGAHSVYAADLDGDGDLDILTASYIDDKIAWYANDGTGNFGVQQIISTDADFAESVYAADLDGDGDMDVLSASVNDNKIAWYENDGTGNFSGQLIISLNANGAFCVYAADIDGDGDMDVLSASHVDDKIAWYENLLETVSVAPILPDTPSTTPLYISPNPTQHTATLTYTTPQSQPVSLHLYDLTGRLLHKETLQATLGTNHYVLDMTKYPNGLYVVTLNNGVEVVSGKLVRE